jgi:tetratricopeptide (TPR) repeat protein
MENPEQSTFASRRLPWLVAIGAFIVYLVTLNRWVSLSSLPVAAMLTDPSGSIPISGPLTYLLSYPLRWLSPTAQIHVSNGLSALLGAITLGLLARSVALLPQDRTRDQRQRERSESGLLSLSSAWVVPLFAALACGLQIAFWEHATAGTGQMLNLALFAYLILCLIEFRIDERESRLSRMALVYGIATTNNPTLIPFFPLFLLALVWIRGREFFQVRFILRLLACGVAGLSLYLLLPLLSQFSDATVVNFWEALRAQLIEQKNALIAVPRYIVLFGALFSILPLIFIGIRWPSTFGDTSAAGVMLTNFLFRVVHALFLIGCLWVILDAPFSPRILIEDLQIRQSAEVTIGLPFLGFHYLTSLCIGYFLGYFLLLSANPPERSRRRVSAGDRFISRILRLTVFALALILPATLVYRNYSSIRANDGRLLRNFAALTLRGIPEENAVAIADDPLLLNLVRIYDRQTRDGSDRIMLYSPLLPYAMYQASLHRLFPERWSDLPDDIPNSAILDSRTLVVQMQSVVSTNATYYLHPSFGYFFERLYLQPEGLAYSLAVYPTNALAPPPLNPEVLNRNTAFWNDVTPHLESLPRAIARRVSDARTVGRWYSRSLDYWGVELQELNQLEEAGKFFTLAARLNPDNLVAKINLEYNQSLQHNTPSRFDLTQSVQDQLGPKYRTLDAFLAANGPVDEPGFRIRLARLLDRQDNLRQAMLQYERALELEPDNRTALLDLADLYLRPGLAREALQTISRLRPLRPTPEEQIQAAVLEVKAHVALGDTPEAEKTLLQTLRTHPNSEPLLDTLAELYKVTDQTDQALEVTDRLLQINPRAARALIRQSVIYMRLDQFAKAEETLDVLAQVAPNNPDALLTRSAYYIQTQRYPEAIQTANQLLELQPGNQWGHINRAIALLQSGQLDDAKAAYLALHERMPSEHRFLYGLGEIAYRQTNHADAIRYYNLYLQHAPADTDEARTIADRLRQLQADQR